MTAAGVRTTGFAVQPTISVDYGWSPSKLDRVRAPWESSSPFDRPLAYPPEHTITVRTRFLYSTR